MDDIFERLRHSPLFHLSLASKELFHSNFLAWLAGEYPQAMAKMFARFLPRPGASRILRAEREQKNVDLRFEFDDGQALVIENKVKSLPREQQLAEYAARSTGETGFLLLSLNRPAFIPIGSSSVTIGSVWHYMSYRDLADGLPELVAENPYHAALLADYIGFIETLDDMQTSVAVQSDEVDFYRLEAGRKGMRRARMHDVVDKIRFSQLAERVEVALRDAGFPVVRAKFPTGEPAEVSVDSNMTRGVGLLDVKYLLAKTNDGEPIMLGVQIQGRDFRIVVEMKSNQARADRIATALLNGRIWFRLDHIPGGAERPAKRNFNQYNGLFLYRSKKLDNASPTWIVDTILSYMNLIRENADTLRGQLALADS